MCMSYPVVETIPYATSLRSTMEPQRTPRDPIYISTAGLLLREKHLASVKSGWMWRKQVLMKGRMLVASFVKHLSSFKWGAH